MEIPINKNRLNFQIVSSWINSRFYGGDIGNSRRLRLIHNILQYNLGNTWSDEEKELWEDFRCRWYFDNKKFFHQLHLIKNEGIIDHKTYESTVHGACASHLQILEDMLLPKYHLENGYDSDESNVSRPIR